MVIVKNPQKLNVLRKPNQTGSFTRVPLPTLCETKEWSCTFELQIKYHTDSTTQTIHTTRSKSSMFETPQSLGGELRPPPQGREYRKRSGARRRACIQKDLYTKYHFNPTKNQWFILKHYKS